MSPKTVIITILIIVVSTINVIHCFAEIKSESLETSPPVAEDISRFVPQPLKELFAAFSDLINRLSNSLSEWPFLRNLFESLPKSFGEIISFLKNIKYWLQPYLDFVFFVITKIGELFVWMFELMARLIKIGLSLRNK